jgi:predicted DNA-binding transcriptional regulator AlpA
MSDDTKTIDRVVSRAETAQLLNMSVRTLTRIEKAKAGPQRTYVSQRLFGYRESAIREFLDSCKS